VGTPVADREIILTAHLVNEQLASVTPPSTVDMGYYAAGSTLDFYLFSSWGGGFWGYSSHLGGTPTAGDRETFLDINNSLPWGGNAIEVRGANDWVLHLDAPYSRVYDDDDNELLVRVFVDTNNQQGSQIPEPTTLALLGLGLGLVGHIATRRNQPN
jgi:hypothetical protein